MKIAIYQTSPVPLRKLLLPISESGISAGFPSPADDYLDNGIDLNRELRNFKNKDP